MLGVLFKGHQILDEFFMDSCKTNSENYFAHRHTGLIATQNSKTNNVIPKLNKKVKLSPLAGWQNFLVRKIEFFTVPPKDYYSEFYKTFGKSYVQQHQQDAWKQIICIFTM